jgi:hypothetical protein
MYGESRLGEERRDVDVGQLRCRVISSRVRRSDRSDDNGGGVEMYHGLQAQSQKTKEYWAASELVHDREKKGSQESVNKKDK